MKKIFTLLSACAIASSAFAVTNLIDQSTVKIDKCVATPEMKMQIAANHERLAREAMSGELSGDAVMSRYTKDGYDYTVVMAYQGFKLQDYWRLTRTDPETGKPDTLTFEKMPLYIVDYVLFRSKEGESERESFCEGLVTWPSYMYWDIYSQENVNNHDMVPLTKIATEPDFCHSFAYLDDNIVTYFYDNNEQRITHYSMWSNLMKDNMQMYAGQPGNFADPTSTNYSYFSINSYDAEENVISTTNHFVIAYGTNGIGRGTIDVDYEDTGRIMGFEKLNIDMQFGQPHVFNVGPYSSKIDTKNPFDFDFDEVNRFFIFVPRDCMFVWVKPEATSFDQDMVRIDWNENLPSGFNKNTNFCYLCGFIYAPKGAETPKGAYEMKPIEFAPNPYNPKEELIYMIPTDYSMIPSNYDTSLYLWPKEAGMECVYQQYYQYLAIGSKIGIETDRGFVLNGMDIYGNSLVGQYKGKYVYHPNPNNMQESVERDSMGDISKVENVAESALQVVAANGSVSVVAAEACNVAVYNMAGACVANAQAVAGEVVDFQLANGIYVVKAGNATAKVIL